MRCPLHLKLIIIVNRVAFETHQLKNFQITIPAVNIFFLSYNLNYKIIFFLTRQVK